MKTSESNIKIAPAFLDAQRKITFAEKNARNPHFKNTYADLQSVIDAVKEPLNQAGISFIQSPTYGEDGRLYLTTRLLHTSGEWIEDTGAIPVAKQDPQGFGSALSYFKRYSLVSICGLYQDDDDGEKAKVSPSNSLDKYIVAINDCKTLDALKDIYFMACEENKGNPLTLKSLEVAKDNRKKEIDK
jgi:hypothetical protein